MRAAGLEIVENIMETEAVLITNPNSKHKDILATLKKRIEGYLTATKYSVSFLCYSI
jgi:ATP phosphoribosyltransferase